MAARKLNVPQPASALTANNEPLPATKPPAPAGKEPPPLFPPMKVPAPPPIADDDTVLFAKAARLHFAYQVYPNFIQPKPQRKDVERYGDRYRNSQPYSSPIDTTSPAFPSDLLGKPLTQGRAKKRRLGKKDSVKSLLELPDDRIAKLAEVEEVEGSLEKITKRRKQEPSQDLSERTEDGEEKEKEGEGEGEAEEAPDFFEEAEDFGEQWDDDEDDYQNDDGDRENDASF